MQNTVGLLTWLRRGAFPCMAQWHISLAFGVSVTVAGTVPESHRVPSLFREITVFVVISILSTWIYLFIWILVWSCTRIFATPPPSRCRIVVHDVPLGRKGRRDG